jgi:uncharacterized protein
VELKPSTFNVFSDEVAGKRLLFNTLTHNLATISSSEYDALCRGHLFDNRAEELGFVVRHDFDEAGFASHLREQVKNAPEDHLHVTIVPGLACNYSCGYCYNGIGHQALKVAGVFEKAKKHIHEHLSVGKDVHVTWYGGEPLLYLAPIERFSKDIAERCSSLGSRYSSDLLTNASLLTPEVGEVLSKLHLTSIQVSIDWPVKLSERHRPGESPQAALAGVLAKINNVPNDIDVTIRINVFPGFLDTFSVLVAQLKASVDRPFEAYIHRIHKSNDPKQLERSLEFSILDPEEYHYQYAIAVNQLEESGLYPYDMPEMNEHGLCMAESKSKVVIGPFEGVRKCIREVYGEGAVIDDQGIINEVGSYYLNSTLPEGSVCRKCTYLPICGGGCVKDQLESPEDVSDRCTPWKYVLPDRLTRRLRAELSKEERHGR